MVAVFSSAARIGTAGWSIPAPSRAAFPVSGSQLERYATRLNAAEINSSFYRPHRRSTYERWAASVPADFRFSVKLPKTITHELRLVGGQEVMARFAGEIAGLGAKRGPILVQLAPSLIFDADVAAAFFTQASAMLGGTIVCEPRHASWFDAAADALLVAHRIARVAADPAKVPGAAQPGGWRGLHYTRLHGSPQMYRSEYDAAAIADHATAARASPGESWTIYDNTTAGFALANALELARMLGISAQL
ncbi:DUF72 domain-containing protein [Sphingomonas sp. PB4P5]|uniref:DUF72 domain-containing protein n=1 Tax=Parasphingomonas puruogangriensis TaxID=3096155 RepID=UPI002FC9838A